MGGSRERLDRILSSSRSNSSGRGSVRGSSSGGGSGRCAEVIGNGDDGLHHDSASRALPAAIVWARCNREAGTAAVTDASLPVATVL